MFESKPILCIDFGAGGLKLAEFEVDATGSLRLLRFGIRALGLPAAQDGARESALGRGLQELLAGHRISIRGCNACVPGLEAFSKFVRLPPLDAAKAAQVIPLEAQHHVPFPLEQAVWDYHVLGTLSSGESELVLAAIKSDSIAGLVRATERARLRLDVVDAAPAALGNAFRYNYSEVEGCSALLDIGARTSNLLLLEGDKVFWRTINLGANAITEGFAAEARLPFAEAEKIKRAEGFVGLGGAYVEPDDARQAVIAKIARQVMTRLHLQVNQTIQFYRGQHGGTAPQRLFLAGGGATMPQTAQFFAEKLSLPVEYFNPFRQVLIAPSVNTAELARVAHGLGEVVGLGLRTSTQCPLELSLLPKSVLKQQQSIRKKPYVLAALAALILVMSVMGWFLGRLAAEKQAAIAERKPGVNHLQRKARQLELALAKKTRKQQAADQLGNWMSARFYWSDLLADLERALEATEANTRHPGIRPNVWIEKMTAEVPETLEPEEESPRPSFNLEFLRRYFPEQYALLQAQNTQGISPLPVPGRPSQSQPAPAATNEITTLHLTCRAVSWNQVFPSADSQLTYTLLRHLHDSPYSLNGTNGTRLTGLMVPDQKTGTFAFEAILALKNPIRL